MNRRSFLKTTSTADGAGAAGSKLSTLAIGQSVQAGPTFRRPEIILPVPTPEAKFLHVEDGVPDTQLTREATGLLREFSTPLLFNHSDGERFDVELLFVCAAFHDLGLLKKFSSTADRFEVDSANAARQFLEHHGIPETRIQTAWDAISLHTTPGIGQYKQLEVELLFNGVGLDVLGIGYETFPEDLRKKVVARFPRVNFKEEIAKAFLGGFESKTQSTEGTCNEDICSHFIRNYKRSNSHGQIQNSRFQNS